MVIKVQGVYANGTEPDGSAEPLEPTEQPLSWPKGADGYIEITVVDPAGEPVDLTGRAVAVGLRAFGFDASPILTRAATLTSPLAGVCRAPLVAADTEDLDLGTLRFDAWVTDDDGRHQITKASSFELLEADILPGESPSAGAPISPLTDGTVLSKAVVASADGASDCSFPGVRVGDTIIGAVDPSGVLDLMDAEQAGGAYFGPTVLVDDEVPQIRAIPSAAESLIWVIISRRATTSPVLGGGGAALATIQIAGDHTTTNTVDEEDVVGEAKYFNFDDVDWTVVLCRLMATVVVSGGTGTFRVRRGGTRGLADGTVIAEGTSTSTGLVAFTATAAAFAKPSGQQLLQVTWKNGTVGQSATIKDITITLRSAS